MHDQRADGEAARLAAFRTGLYGCFGRWADTLFELTDALAGAGRPVRSVAELMFDPALRRGWGSLYQALEHGGIDPDAARDLLARQVRTDGALVMFAIDASKYPRPDTRYVPDVGMQYAAERDTGAGGAPAVPGWQMQWVAQVGYDGVGATRGGRSSWTLPVDVRRVPTNGSANEVAAVQIAELTARLQQTPGSAQQPLFLLDAGYCPIYLTQQLPAGAQILIRLRSDRVFFGRPPARVPGRVGRPRKHGDRFVLAEPDTWGDPDAQFTAHTGDGATVTASAWHHKHPEPRQRRKWEGTGIVEGTLIRREHTHRSGRSQVWWLWWAGEADTFDLAVLGLAYEHRFTIEHGFRFGKQDLSWTAHTPLDPDQAERWTWLVLFAHAQLYLARPLVTDRRLPWEKRCTPGQLSPRRVRRGFRHATAHLPTPARAPKPSRPGPGRPAGSKNKRRRHRYPVIKKGRPANTGHKRGRSPLAKVA